MKKKYNAIDIFSGAGGLSYGFEQAGFNILLGIDNDEDALNTFKINHKDSKTLCADIAEVSFAEHIKPLIGKNQIDVIVGGPPCQGMSLSGPRKFDDPRNSLYLSYIRLVEEIRPKAFVIENVPGLVGLFKGEIKDSIIEKFSNMGYKVTYKILLASDFGVPQNRKRVFFIGLENFEFDFEFPKFETVTTEMAISDLPPLTENLGQEVAEYTVLPKNAYQKIMRKDAKKLLNHVAANHSQRIKDIISLVPAGGNYKTLPEEYRTTRNFNVAWTRFPKDAPAPTIDTGHRHHFHYEYNRVPTVRESARLQSFPDDFKFTGSKTKQFRQVGNAVPPLMAKVIAEKLIEYLWRS